jgi:hypothetical protein
MTYRVRPPFLDMLVVIALVGCGRDDRLIDRSASQLDELCASHPLLPYLSNCSSRFCNYPQSCAHGGTNLTCEALIKQLPDNCNATPDDYLTCQNSDCSTFHDNCAAFRACGIEVYGISCSSC